MILVICLKGFLYPFFIYVTEHLLYFIDEGSLQVRNLNNGMTQIVTSLPNITGDSVYDMTLVGNFVYISGGFSGDISGYSFINR